MKHTRLAFLMALIPTLAHAHPGHGVADGAIGWGLLHPFTGLDHILAMIAVGLWAVQLGKRALWMLPLTFVSAMSAGAVLGMNGVRLPFVEPAVLASVVGLGALVAFAARLPLGTSAAAIAVAAFFHGQAHGREIAASASGIFAVMSLIAATAALHAAGVAGGLALQRAARQRVIQAAGVGIVLTAAMLRLGVF
jgi:urease accessory protein